MTLDFEIQEAVAFRTGAAAAFADLRDQLAKRDAARTETAAAGIDRLGRLVGVAAERRDGVPTADEVEAETERVEDALDAAMPEPWKEGTDESDYDLIALTLDRMEAAAGAGQYRQAEQARLEAYAFFEFGPERRLKAFDPGPRARGRGRDLVRRRRPAGPGQADRRPRAAARAAGGAPRARRAARRLRRHARRQRERRHGRHQLGDPRLPRGPRGGAHPRRHHRLVRRRRAGGCGAR